MVFNNILVAYDGSKTANIAFKKAIDLAKQHGSNILVATCLYLPDVGGWYIDNRINADIMKKAREHSKYLIAQLEATATKNSVPVTSYILETNHKVKNLLTLAKSKNADLIIVGFSGRGKFDRLLLGSVSNGLMQKATCPVLIIK